MLEAIRRAMSFLRQKQILHKVGVVISVTVIGIACYVLYHMLRGIDVNEVIEAIKGTEPRQIVLAALFVGAGYFDLATPFFATEYTLSHMGLDPRAKANFTLADYEAGHMMYIHVPSLAQLKQDLVNFMRGAIPSV